MIFFAELVLIVIGLIAIGIGQFSDDDLVTILKQLKAGARPAIHLSVIGGQPPVSMWVRKNED